VILRQVVQRERTVLRLAGEGLLLRAGRCLPAGDRPPPVGLLHRADDQRHQVVEAEVRKVAPGIVDRAEVEAIPMHPDPGTTEQIQAHREVALVLPLRAQLLRRPMLQLRRRRPHRPAQLQARVAAMEEPGAAAQLAVVGINRNLMRM